MDAVMKKVISSCLILMPLIVQASSLPKWTYEGKSGPENWGDISSEYITCKKGKFQSPVDIKNVIDAKLPHLDLVFKSANERLVNNGHTIEIKANSEEEFPLDGETFRLVQYHFHTPSENKIDGKSYPLEAHFVHVDNHGDIAVVAVMFETGKENTALNPILNAIPDEVNKEVDISGRYDLEPLFPKEHSYYRFSGSLTTPPCTEGLRWLVMTDTVALSESQLKKFQIALKHSNNRPVQPLNGRMIVN